ncbi:calcineurin-like phosphoesterase C-terminal domain-containing protein [Mucilaginibacter sp. KACC 22063]|uniref:calcineurin-like phosphoesterase C-terminal domain-containing protein n=1 Tax=Mucilaginibacter sp. KACC 22063 TaxID=3025666 RepID=UPI0023655E93|nr:calcineurin-like phosphoesterase C-terminal domain-containing protein [Mucilaginibacter sp. KACC 22063]WDF56674.1 calcineurin-like phosphoesterase C-terminal domain-containing protein [Mucilaginibacter sp. KACC 22063]
MSNRRDFLKGLGIAGAAIAIPETLVQAAPVSATNNDKRDLTNLTLKGRVHSNGAGIAGVAVTDGINITRTNKSGRYTLLSNKTAEFVYISLPSGYTFPQQKGLVQFYKRIDTSQNVFTADFALEKLNTDDKKHIFVVWADPQIISKKDAEVLVNQAAPDLRDLAKSYPAGTLIHAVGCGDLVWDHFELLEDYKQAVEISSVPFFNLIGNHDMDLNARTDDYSAETFKTNFGPTYYSYNRGDVHYVVLDDVFFIGTAKKYIGYITENQLQWLEQDLATVKPGTTVIVSLHIPTNTGSQRRNKLVEEEIGGVVSNREQLYKILAPYKVHIMSGHTHMNEKWERDNMMEHVHGTVCGAWWTGPVCTDGTPEGYAVYEINGGDVNWYYKSTGKPKDYQLKVYEKGRYKAEPGAVVANVWNWDPKWKIEWFEDGQPKGEMERKVAFDPLAVELYEGPQLPKKHKFVDPTLTDHLFFATPSANAKKVKVVATDRFGKAYSEEIAI